VASNLKGSGDDAPTDEAPAAATLSVKYRQDRIRKAHKEISALETEIEGLKARTKGLNKSIGDVFRKIESHLGIKRKDLQAIRRLISLEDDDRAETEDSLRECYEALRPGEQLDWLKATEPRRTANDSTRDPASPTRQ
jgi:septal ring factor EnvC (AmiA/AmiB activator)